MNFLAEKVIRFHKIFLLLWIIITLALGIFALKLPSLLEGDGFEMDSEYSYVENELTETFNMPKSTVLVLFERTNSETAEQFKQKIGRTIDDIRKIKNTSTVQSPIEDETLLRPDMAYAVIGFDEVDESAYISAMKKTIGEKKGIQITGQPVLNEDINQASQDDLKRAELIGIPFAIIILLLAFGSIVASAVPIIVGIVSIISSFGAIALLSDSIDMSIFILNIVPMIGLALSIDFSLLFINRYREELKKFDSAQAAKRTILTAGRSILFSALCVFIGLGAMLVIKIDIFQTVAAGGMIVVGMAVFSSLTLLPSILVLLGPSINKWMLLKVSESGKTRWKRFAERVIKHPVLITIVSFVILFIGMIPIQDINLVIPKADSLPSNYESRIAYEKIEAEFFDKEESTVYAVAERDGNWTSKEGLQDLQNLIDYFEAEKIVSSIDSIYGIAKVDSPETMAQLLAGPETQAALEPALVRFIQKDKLLLPIHLSENDTSVAAQDWVKEQSERKTEFDLSFGGTPKFNQEIFDEIFDKFPTVLLIIIISTFIILLFAFRSIIIPMKAILMNVIGLGSAFGILVWIFQYGNLGLPETDLSLIIPVLVFSLVFGLSMDYEVFLISRIQEIYEETQDNNFATVEGLASTSKIITSAALIMIVITGAFAFTGVMPVKQIGVGIAIAIFIDATIIRMLLVPSLMKLLGEWNWWLPFVKKNAAKQRGK